MIRARSEEELGESVGAVRVDPAPGRAASRKSCWAARRFGLLLDPPGTFAGPVGVELPPLPDAGSMVVSGPSGAGKTTLLREMRTRLRAEGIVCIETERVALRRAPAVDQFRSRSVDEAMSALAGAGLAEAACFVRRPEEMSEGQRRRLRLAIAMDRLRRALERGDRAALLIDGFCDGLDDATARSCAHLLGRFARQAPPSLVLIATTRDQVAGWIGADEHLRIDPDGRIRRARVDAALSDKAAPYAIERGTIADYRALAHTHYRAGDPASCALVLRAIERERGELVGALVVSMPTLNGAWRDLAWPGRYTSGDRRADVARLNDEVRRISRVVVCQRHRGMGLATRLTEAYLADPLTPCTEAVAAMGRLCAFFERAGMTPYRLAPTKRDARLLDALAHAGVEEWRLATPRAAFDRAIRGAGEAFIEREVRRWARASRASRSLSSLDLQDLFRRACRRLCAGSTAHAHTAVDF